MGAHTLPEPSRGNRTAPSDYEQLSVQYRSAANVLHASLRNEAAPRRTPAGVPLTGAGVAHLLRALVVGAGDEESGLPAFPDAWSTWEQHLLDVAAKDATARTNPSQRTTLRRLLSCAAAAAPCRGALLSPALTTASSSPRPALRRTC